MLRLTERFPIGTAVEIYFEAVDVWLVGVVVTHQPPAVWVQTADGRQWFVTNGRRIRVGRREEGGVKSEK